MSGEIGRRRELGTSGGAAPIRIGYKLMDIGIESLVEYCVRVRQCSGCVSGFRNRGGGRGLRSLVKCAGRSTIPVGRVRMKTQTRRWGRGT